MEVKIGVQHTPRELVIEAPSPPTRSRRRSAAALEDRRRSADPGGRAGPPGRRPGRPDRLRGDRQPDSAAWASAPEGSPAPGTWMPETAGRGAVQRVADGSTAAQPLRPSAFMRSVVRVGDPLDQPGDAGRGRPCPPRAASASASRSASHPLRLGDRLADQPPPPQREPAGDRRVGRDRRPHLARRRRRRARCRRAPRGPARGRPRSRNVGDLAVEVGGHPVADVGLDQALEPGPRRGAARGRRRARATNGAIASAASTPELGQPLGEPAVVADLRGRHRARARPGRPGSGASRASSASRSNAVSSPYASTPSRSATALVSIAVTGSPEVRAARTPRTGCFGRSGRAAPRG